MILPLHHVLLDQGDIRFLLSSIPFLPVFVNVCQKYGGSDMWMSIYLSVRQKWAAHEKNGRMFPFPAKGHG